MFRSTRTRPGRMGIGCLIALALFVALGTIGRLAQENQEKAAPPATDPAMAELELAMREVQARMAEYLRSEELDDLDAGTLQLQAAADAYTTAGEKVGGRVGAGLIALGAAYEEVVIPPTRAYTEATEAFAACPLLSGAVPVTAEQLPEARRRLAAFREASVALHEMTQRLPSTLHERLRGTGMSPRDIDECVRGAASGRATNQVLHDLDLQMVAKWGELIDLLEAEAGAWEDDKGLVFDRDEALRACEALYAELDALAAAQYEEQLKAASRLERR